MEAEQCPDLSNWERVEASRFFVYQSTLGQREDCDGKWEITPSLELLNELAPVRSWARLDGTIPEARNYHHRSHQERKGCHVTIPLIRL